MKSLSALTRREVEVADLICRGFSQAQTARALRIGEETVKSHMKRIRVKMKSPNTISAMVRYSQMRSALSRALFERSLSLEQAPSSAPIFSEFVSP